MIMIMTKNEKILIGTLVGIAVVNFFFQYMSSKKMEEIKKAIIQK